MPGQSVYIFVWNPYASGQNDLLQNSTNKNSATISRNIEDAFGAHKINQIWSIYHQAALPGNGNQFSNM